jgi:hypothetical protein
MPKAKNPALGPKCVIVRKGPLMMPGDLVHPGKGNDTPFDVRSEHFVRITGRADVGRWAWRVSSVMLCYALS